MPPDFPAPMRFRPSLAALALLAAAAPVRAQTPGVSDVLLQGFYWNTHPGDINTASGGIWWDSLAVNAPKIAGAGFATVWIPSPAKGGSGRLSMGYDLYDYYDFGQFIQKGTSRTRFGNKAQFDGMMASLHGAGLRVMVDAVVNHRDGGDATALPACGGSTNRRFTVFRPGSRRFPADSTTFNPTAPHCDEAAPYHNNIFGQDIGYFQQSDQTIPGGWFNGPHTLGRAGDSLVVWGRWLVAPASVGGAGFDEIRVDAIKHIEPGFLSPWLRELRAGEAPFTVGEYFGSTAEILDYQRQVASFGSGSRKAALAVFDFGLRFGLKEMADGNGGFDMGRLNTTGLHFSGLDAGSVVTFVENHDFDRVGYSPAGSDCPIRFRTACLTFSTDTGHDPVTARKHLAYAYLMAAEGRPTVFYKDFFWYGLGDEMAWLMALRRSTASGESAQMSFLAPFYQPGSSAQDFWAIRRAGDGTAKTGAVVTFNDRGDGALQEGFVDTAWRNVELRDYSDAYLFQSSRVFEDGRAYVKADGGNYAWYAPTGLYPQQPGEPALPFTVAAAPGGKLHYVVLRAADAAQMRVGTRALAAGDVVAVCNLTFVTGGGSNTCGNGVAGIARNGLSARWDGVSDLVLEVLGNEGDVTGFGRLNPGQGLRLVVYGAAENERFEAGAPTFAAAGTTTTFRAQRPASRGPATFPITTTATGTYTVGGISVVTGFSAARVVSTERAEAPPRAEIALDAWPSPARDVLTVRASTGGEVGTLALVDVLGRTVAARPLDAADDAQEHRLDVSGLAPGLYALRLTTASGTRTRSVVVAR